MSVGLWAAVAAATLLVSCSVCLAQGQVRTDIRAVATDVQFQRAVRDNVRHIVVTDHIDMFASQTELEGQGESLDTGVVVVKSETKSIVGNCTSAPPSWFELAEAVPAGACAVVVRSDFMEAGLDVTELWLARLYIAGAPSRASSHSLATLILHKAGELWVTDSVLQGRNSNGRAIDVTAADGGTPRLFMQDVVVVNMVGYDMPGVRCGQGTHCTITATAFKHNAITSHPASCQCGSAVGVRRGGMALLRDIGVVNNTITGAPAGARAVAAVLGGVDPAAVYSDPPMNIWDITARIVVTTRPTGEALSLPSHGTHLQGLQQEQAELWAALAPPLPDPSSGSGGGGGKTQALEAAVGAIGGVLGLVTIVAAAALVYAYARRRGGPHSDLGSFKLGRRNTQRGGPEIPRSVDGATIPFGLTHGSTSYPPSFAGLGRAASLSHSTTSNPSSHAPHAHALGPGGASGSALLPPEMAPPWALSHHAAAAAAASAPGAVNAAAHWPSHSAHNSASVRSYSSHSYPAVFPWSGGRPGGQSSQANSAASDAALGPSLPLGDANGSPHDGMHGIALRSQAALGFLRSGSLALERFGSVGAVGVPLLPPEGVTHSTTIDTTAAPPLPPPDAATGEVAVLDGPLLEHALDNMHAGDELFMGKFAILGPMERRAGGQGIVQFAVARPTGEPVAVKFFLNRKAFDCEAALYEKEHLRGMMPAVTLVHSNDDGSLKTHEGWFFPPCIVVERGESLDEWRVHVRPDFCTIAQVLIHVTERVATLHAAGVVHRDLKPGNVLWRPRDHTWTLIDYGCAAEMGSTTRLTFSMAYSPPETLHALYAGARTITSDAASDIWAIGVITYELVLGRPAFTAREWTREQLTQAALGQHAYPWEVPGHPGQFRHIPEARALSSSLRACLNRSPSRRPTSAALSLRVNQLFDDAATTSETAPCKSCRVPGAAPRTAEAGGPRHEMPRVHDMPSARGVCLTTSASVDFSTTNVATESAMAPGGNHTGRTRHIFHVPTTHDDAPQRPPSACSHSAEGSAVPGEAQEVAGVYRGSPGGLPMESGAHATFRPPDDGPAPPERSATAPQPPPTRAGPARYEDLPRALLPLSFGVKEDADLPPEQHEPDVPPLPTAASDSEFPDSSCSSSDSEEAVSPAATSGVQQT